MVNQKSSAGVAGAMIALCTAVALLCNFGGSVSGQREAEEIAKDAALANAQPDQGMFQGYQQLSDPLLVLVNGEVPLPETWEFLPFLVDDQVVDRRMGEDLSRMLHDGEEEGVWLWVASGYRSRERQQALLDQAVREILEAGMGEEEALADALKTLAQPGHSEHETGLAVDFNDVSPGFADTKASRWLEANAWKYGFVQRYKGAKTKVTGVEEESWHYRYVGRDHAREMEEKDLCLEEYVLYRKALGDN